MVYTIGKMAELLGVAPSTLRYYDKEGLLPFVERSNGGIRIFKESDYEWLKIIECLKKTGMMLKDIRKFVLLAMQGDDTIDERLSLVIEQQSAVEKQIKTLLETLETLKFKRWYYETAQKEGTTERLKNLPTEDFPEEYRETRRRLHSR